MNLIIDFYKELDTINLIVFWGIILVIFLLLIFAIIITNKNKRLRRIIVTKEQEIEKKDDELAIKQNLIDEKEKVVINKTENKDIYVNRIMFPLYDLNGRVVGFSGRRYDGIKDTKKRKLSPYR